MTKILLIAILIFSLTGMPFGSMAQTRIDPQTGKILSDSIGEVTLSHGTCDIIRGKDNSKTLAAVGVKMNRGDIIKTHEKSFVRITMIDETIVQLGPNSIFKFEQFNFKAPDQRQSIYNFVAGQLRTSIKNKAQAGDIQIKARRVSMGVRGTEILSDISENAEGIPVTRIALLKGKVNVDVSEQSQTIRDFDLNTEEYFDSGRWDGTTPIEKSLSRLSPQQIARLNERGLTSPNAPALFLSDVTDDQGQTTAHSVPTGDNERSHSVSNSSSSSWAQTLSELQAIEKKSIRPLPRPSRSIASIPEPVCVPKKVEECITTTYHEEGGQLVPVCTEKRTVRSTSHCQ